MIILDKQYITEEMKNYLINGKVPVLKNDAALKHLNNEIPNLISKEDFAKLYSQNRRLYTCFENSIEWIVQNVQDKELIKNIETMKNKALLRKMLAPIYSDFFYRQATLKELPILDTATFFYPFILKPNVGFFSVGVYSITCKEDWDIELMESASDWGKIYSESVVNTEFILEQYIYGEEYAIDAYYDEDGKAVVLNILKHDFNGMSDVSDRLYYTGKCVIEQHLEQFTNWLNDVNEYIKASNIPFHVEIRVNSGRIIPIEFNPMRFAGWNCTDISYYAFGFYTYDYYLHNIKPDWDSLLKGKDGKYYTIIVLDKNISVDRSDNFDYDSACQDMGKILCLRKINYHETPVFGFVFTEVEETDKLTMKKIIEKGLSIFVRKGE